MPVETNSKGANTSVVASIIERLDLKELPQVLDAYRRFIISTIISLTLGYIFFSVY